MMSAILPIDVKSVTTSLSTWLYTSVRVSSFFLTTPFFGQLTIPVYFKVILTFLIAFIVSITIAPISTHVAFINSGLGIFAVMQEVLIGAAMGFIFKMTFEILNLTGQMAATAMQLNFASAYSPQDHTQTNVLGSFYQIFGMLIFICMHGPMILLTVLYKSFIAMPIGKSYIAIHQIQSLLQFSEKMFEYSLLLALPVMITMLMINTGMAVVSRLASMLNIFSVGFPVSMLIGMIMLTFSLTPSLANFIEILKQAFAYILHWQVTK